MGDSRNLKILLVEDGFEDDQLLCEALLEIGESRQWCNWRGSCVEHTDCLAAALQWLARDSFDVILLNLSLPDSPSLLDSFLIVKASAAGVPIVVLADEPDENLANRLVREGAQDILVKSELECTPLARSIRYAIERERRARAAQASAFVDALTGVLTRDALLAAATHGGRRELLALIEVAGDRDALDPLLIQAAELLRTYFGTSSLIGRWDQRRFCVITSGLSEGAVEAMLDNANHTLSFQFSISPFDCSGNLEEILTRKLRPHTKTAILTD
ncbi:MAG: hypothetical protein JOZ32_21055 [Bryobacterales bacterium]|nr:hypothetical protein [Bryobacterales bacterium]